MPRNVFRNEPLPLLDIQDLSPDRPPVRNPVNCSCGCQACSCNDLCAENSESETLGSQTTRCGASAEEFPGPTRVRGSEGVQDAPSAFSPPLLSPLYGGSSFDLHEWMAVERPRERREMPRQMWAGGEDEQSFGGRRVESGHGSPFSYGRSPTPFTPSPMSSMIVNLPNSDRSEASSDPPSMQSSTYDATSFCHAGAWANGTTFDRGTFFTASSTSLHQAEPQTANSLEDDDYFGDDDT